MNEAQKRIAEKIQIDPSATPLPTETQVSAFQEWLDRQLPLQVRLSQLGFCLPKTTLVTEARDESERLQNRYFRGVLPR